MTEEFDNNYDLNDNTASPAPKNKAFGVVVAILSVLLIAGLAVTAVWVMNKLNAAKSADPVIAEGVSAASAYSTATAVMGTQRAEAVALSMPTRTLPSAAEPAATQPAESTAEVSTISDAPDAAADSQAMAAEATPELPANDEELAAQINVIEKSGLNDPARTATVSALLTAVAGNQSTAQATSTIGATALPATGFADEVGIPAMVGVAVVLIALIIIVRRVRTSSVA